MALIVPSLLAFDLSRLDEAVDAIGRAGARRIHVDVCDGHFAPGITVGQPVIERLRRATSIQLEVHLLVERPERFAGDFVDAGARRIAIHPESTTRFWHALREIRARGGQCGAALNPSIPVEAVAPALRDVDFLILLTEESEVDTPGVRHRVRFAAEARAKSGSWFEIAVEGSFDPESVASLAEAGADILVLGAAKERRPDAGVLLTELLRGAPSARGSIERSFHRE